MSNKLKSIFLFLICLVLFVLPLLVLAQEKFFGGETATEMIRNIYWFGVGIVGFAAVVVIVIAGIMYMQSYGDPQKITMAKQLIGGALIGVIILLFSYTILRTVNPALVSLREPELEVEIHGLPGEECNSPKDCISGYCTDRNTGDNQAKGICLADPVEIKKSSLYFNAIPGGRYCLFERGYCEGKLSDYNSVENTYYFTWNEAKSVEFWETEFCFLRDPRYNLEGEAKIEIGLSCESNCQDCRTSKIYLEKGRDFVRWWASGGDEQIHGFCNKTYQTNAIDLTTGIGTKSEVCTRRMIVDIRGEYDGKSWRSPRVEKVIVIAESYP